MNRQEELAKANEELEQIKAKADDIKARIARLEKNEPERWRAERGGCYYSVQSNGQVIGESDCRCSWSNARWDIGNYFKTREEAESFAKVFRNMTKTPPDYEYGNSVEQSRYGKWVDGYWCEYDWQIAYHYMGLLRRKQ